MYNEFDRDVTYEIMESIGVIATYPTGWRKELNLVSWNGGAAKYDIRDWAPDYEQMSRGITLHEKEMRTIVELLKKRRPMRRNNNPPVRITQETKVTVSTEDTLPIEQEASVETSIPPEVEAAASEVISREGIDDFDEVPADM
jgi:hypothetical protein